MSSRLVQSPHDKNEARREHNFPSGLNLFLGLKDEQAMKQYQPPPPDASEIPTGFTIEDGVHELPWEEKDRADDFTAKARRKVGKLAAAFNAFWHVAGFDDICKEAGIDGGELRRMYMVILELAMRAEDHAERDGCAPSRVRRFHCPDYAAELCYRREFLRGDSEEEKAKQRAAHSRAWRERWKRTIHAAQCRNHLPLVERQSGGIFGKRKVATVYTERLADVLAMIVRRADPNRGRVARYTRAAEVALNHLRQTVEPYAPDFEYTPERKDPDPLFEEDASEARPINDPPYITLLKRAVKAAKKGAAYATTAEKAARRLEMHEWLDALWPDDDPEQKNAHPLFSSVERKVDASKIGTAPPAEVVSKTHIPEGENCDFPPENGDLSEKKGDVHVPLFSGVEYDPEPEPRGQSTPDALAALGAFASVGVTDFKIVMVDETRPRGENCALTEDASAEAFAENMGRYLERNSARPESLAVRPAHTRRLIQIDDCTAEVLERLAPFCFLQELTSPANGQAWLCVSDKFGSDEEFKTFRTRLLFKLKDTGANGGAYGSTRWPGSLNRKPSRRYADGESPRVQLLRLQPGRTVSIAELDAAGLLAPLPPKKTPEQIREIKGRLPQGWPDLNEFLHRHAGDRSRAEFAWSCRAIEMGWPRYRVEEELSRIGAKARTRTRDDYVTDTVNSAARQVGVRA
jgi:hypothetical protein